MKLGSSDRLKSIFRHVATMTVLCGATFLLLSAPNAWAQAPAGPLPAHEQTDVDAPPRAQAASANSGSQEGGPAKISGVWKLNKDQSDDPRKAMQAAGGGGQGGGGGRGGWGGGGNGGGSGAGGGRGRGGNGGRGGGGGGMMADYDQLTIGQTGSAVKITGSSGRILAESASSSGDNSKSQSGDSLDSTPAGVWQGSQYVVTTQTGRGKTTRSYGLSQDETQLILRTRIESPRLDQPVTFRQVYDPVKASSSDQ